MSKDNSYNDSRLHHTTENGKLKMRELILEICTAYEQGYGHGYAERGLSNPYSEETVGWEAWDYGYCEGQRVHAQHEENEKHCDDYVMSP